MSLNTSILTETARQVAELEIAGYLNGVAAHIGGDWSQHPVVRVYTNTAYLDASSGTVAPHTLRLKSTAGSVDMVLAAPILLSGSAAGPEGSSPFIIQQPSDMSAAAGSQAQTSVTVISAATPSYQWYNITETSVAVDGATSSVLLFSSVQTSDAGTYRARVWNSYGEVFTNPVRLTVT